MKKTVEAYFHLSKGYLWEHEEITNEELSEEARDMVRYFGYEHEFTAELDLETGNYTVTHFDGRKIEDE